MLRVLLVAALCGTLLTPGARGQCVPPFGKKAVVEVIAGAGDGLGVPTDLAFHPLKEGELWVGSADRTDGRANGNFIIKDAGASGQSSRFLRDRIAYHYQDQVTAITFDHTGEKFFSCQESTNEYLKLSPGPNYFMGPTAYEVKPCGEGYGREQSDGSCRDLSVTGGGMEGCAGGDACFIIHSDMLHEAPLCTGIAHDSKAVTGTTGLNGIETRTPGNTVWYMDGIRGKLMRFDFDKLHTTELIDHRFANIRRYVDVDIKRVPGVPGHMVVDADARMLYIADAGNKRILRVDADSGRFLRDAKCISDMCFPEHNERYTCYPTAGPTVLHESKAACDAACDGDCFWNYYEMGCEAGHCTRNECAGADGLGCYTLFTEIGDMFEYELWGCTKYADFASDVGTPSGIALGPDGRIYVGDFDTGNIIAFDKAGNRQATFNTGSKGLGGLELECGGRVGGGCRLWFTNVLRKEVSYIHVTEECPVAEVPAPQAAQAVLVAKPGEATCGLAPNYTRPDYMTRHGPGYNDRMVVWHSYGKNCEGLQPGEQREGMTNKEAELCPDRTDCENMNFDLLVMAGFFCHPCLVSPCMNGASCSNQVFKGFTCECPAGFYGDLCEHRDDGRLDGDMVAGISVATFVFGLLSGGVVMLILHRNSAGSRKTPSPEPAEVTGKLNIHVEQVSNGVPISTYESNI